ncbi:MAG: high-potential iron-sulfur protein [Sandaracinaceae bacterium]
MTERKMGRREAARRALTVLGAAALAPSALAACGGEESGGLSCNDTSSLNPAQQTTRTSQHYVEASTDPAKKCADCRFFTAGAAGQCGSCQVIQGPINPDGNCDLWAART